MKLSDDECDTEKMMHEKELAIAGISQKEYIAAIKNVLSIS